MKAARFFVQSIFLLMGLLVFMAPLCAHADPEPPAFTSVSVKSIASTSGTQLFFRAKLSGFSPLSSGSVTVTWPGGGKVTTFSTSELYYDQLADGSHYRHSESMPSPAPNGDFIFRVNNSLGSDEQTFTFANIPAPVISNASMAPTNVTFTGTAPTFSWSPVAISGKTTYYRVEIYDRQQVYTVYRSDAFSSTDSTVSFTMPSDKLLADVHYQWRVVACDDPDGLLEQNRSNSNFNNFFTGTESAPEFVWTSFRSSNSSSGLQLQYGGQFKGAFPYQVTNCKVTSPANGIDYTFQSSDMASEASGAYYWKTSTATNPQNETVNLTIQTALGGDTEVRPFTFALVPIVDTSSVRVGGENFGNNAYVDTLTPTFSWSPVSIPGKTTYYRAQIFDWNGRILLHSTARQTDASFTVPAGVLQPECSYRLVIRPTDGSTGNAESNQSVSNSYYFTTVNGEGPGTISGYVRQIDGVTPIAGAKIETTGTSSQQATTAADGSYILNLAQGTYRIRASAPGYAREYYDNVTPSQEATLVPVSSGSVVNIDFDLTIGGAISGRILQDNGITPIAGATVRITPSLYFFDDGFQAATNADGYYTVTSLALGQYKVTAEASTYARLKFYDDVYGWRNATPVTVTPPDNRSGVDIWLEPGAVIEGYIRAADNTTPIQVGLIADPLAGVFEGIGTSSNSSGNYRLEGLPPNSYSLRIGNNLPGWYAGEFYNAKQTWNTADRVEVTPGATVSGVNFTLDEGGTITGHVYDAVTLQPVGGVLMAAHQAANGQGVTPTPTTAIDGSYRLNLLPGQYKLAANPSAYLAEWFNGVQNINAANPVTVNLRQTTSGIDFFLNRPGSISGRVMKDDGVTPIGGANVFAFPVDAGINGNGKNTSTDGTYTIDGLMPGNYAVFVTATGHVSASRPASVVGTANTPSINFSLETYPYPVIIVGQSVVGSAGGSVIVTDPSSPIARSGILVPPGVLNQNSVITVGQVHNTPPFLVGIGGIGQAVHFGPEGQTFLSAITLQLPYSDTELQAAGLSGPEELEVYTLNTDTGEWLQVSGSIDADEVNKLIKVDVTHFSIYRLGYDMPPCLGDSEPDGDVDGTDLWEFIDGGSYSGIADFAASFGRTSCQ